MTVTRQQKITFTEADILLFANLSRDHNPLHRDADYARRTSFGQCVVYGILGALVTMRQAVGDAPLNLQRLAVTFERPLFPNVEYSVRSEAKHHGQVKLSLFRGESRKLVIEAEYGLGGRPWKLPDTSSNAQCEYPTVAADPHPELGTIFSGDYQMSLTHLQEFKAATGFRYANIPPMQLSAILWSSYFVGMVFPGKQALFQSIAIEFAGEPEIAFDQSYKATVDAHALDSSMYEVSAELTGGSRPHVFARAKVRAAHRPLPVEHPPSQLEQAVKRSSALAGKVVLVTGSNRGLGSLIALACGLHGADVILHCRSGVAEAKKVASLASSFGCKTSLVTGDLHAPESWQKLSNHVRTQHGHLDVFVNSAFPTVVPMAFSEMSADNVKNWIYPNIMAAVRGFQTVLPLVRNGGHIVNISSIWTQRPKREFCHYIMAKSAIEGLVRNIAAEYPAINFITVRPPALHTDMTNGIVLGLRGRPPEGVAASVLRAVESPSTALNYSVLEDFE